MDDILKHNNWLVADQYSLADIAWIPQYFLLTTFGFPLGEYQYVKRWAQSVERRLAYKRGVTDHLPKFPIWLIKLGLDIKNYFFPTLKK